MEKIFTGILNNDFVLGKKNSFGNFRLSNRFLLRIQENILNRLLKRAESLVGRVLFGVYQGYKRV